MKKILIATTALVATAGMAAADMKLSGYGRFGLDYTNGAAVGTSKTQVNMRMRVNIDGSKETDSGVTFGGRIRMQYTDGDVGATLNAAMLYATYAGMRMEVGNANTAYDSVALMYNSEIGYLDRGFGDPAGTFYSYASTPYGAAEANRMGIFASYSFGDGNVRLSYVDPNQTLSGVAAPKEEIGISADYKFGQFTVAAAAVADGGGIRGNDQYFLGAEYAITPDANVGLLYFDNGDVNGAVAGDLGRRVTLYGNYKMGAITYKGYIANDNNVANSAVGMTKTSYGVGLDYDLGGARLAADIHRSYAKKTVAGLGVRFNF